MAFPIDPLPVKQELYINGSWVDVTSRTRNSDDVNIRRGYSGAQANLSASQCTFTLNNRDGLFSGRNPRSAYYGLLGRNVPYRNSITESTTFMRLADYSDSTGTYDGARAYTADKAVLDVVGDLDVRWDLAADNWVGGEAIMLGGKYVTTGNQRSWAAFVTPNGYLRFIWSTDGTSAARVTITSTDPIPDQQRVALRITLDVNNGAAGNTVTFYTSDTISGSWTQLGDPVITAGVTSIFSGTANLEVGTARDGAGRGAVFISPNVNPFVGRVYGFEMRSGIGGTLVADFDPTGRTPGDTTWSDGLGTPNTWLLTNSAEISNSDYRFTGELSKLPQRWDKTGSDVFVPTSAADIIQRLGQGAKALNSAMFRSLSQYDTDGYWPHEDGTESTQVTAYAGNTGKVSGGRFGTTDGFPGTAGSLTFNDDLGAASGVGIVGRPNTGVAYVLFAFRLPGTPGSPRTIMNFYYTSGSVFRATIAVTATTYTLTITDDDGVTLATSNTLFGTGGEPDQWVTMRLELVQNGGNVDWDWGWYPAYSDVFFGTAGSFVGTAGRPRSWASPGWAGKGDGAQLAHVVLSREDIGWGTFDFVGAVNGWSGETPSTRFGRLCREQGVPYWIVGRLVDNSGVSLEDTMGPQRPLKFLDLVQECAEVSGGLVYGPRDKFGLGLRIRYSLLNRTSVDLDYSLKHLSGELLPEEDDALIRNDVTVERPGGGFSRAVKASGTLNINDPADDPNGVGTYDTRVVRNLETDARLQDFAQFERFLGTWDELRYPRVEVDLARAPFVASASLTSSIRSLDLGDPITITNLPDWLPPEDVDLMIRGYNETLKNRQQIFRWNTTPYGPYRIAKISTEVNDLRLDATNSVLAADITDVATSFVVRTPEGARWRRSVGAVTGTYPLTAKVGGEHLTVSAVADVTLSFVAAGVVAHGNNASVVPGLPAGLAAGDLMFAFTAIRATSATATTPAGWERLPSYANVAIYGKIAGAGEAAPTLAFTGGAAGDDTSAQICAFRPSSPFAAGVLVNDFVMQDQWIQNASAQDIDYIGQPLQDRTWDNALVLYLGWKQDDWTSVASPGTEIGEPDTTTGNDQGIVWAYTIQTTRTAIAAGSFVVTGGAAAISKGCVMYIHPRHQLFTASARAVNGIDLPHSAGDSISLANPARVGL
jgi:hypothetical protein